MVVPLFFSWNWQLSCVLQHFCLNWQLSCQLQHRCWNWQLSCLLQHFCWNWQLSCLLQHFCWNWQLSCVLQHFCWNWQLSCVLQHSNLPSWDWVRRPTNTTTSTTWWRVRGPATCLTFPLCSCEQQQGCGSRLWTQRTRLTWGTGSGFCHGGLHT